MAMPSPDFDLPVLGAIGGLVLLVVGFTRKGEADAFAGAPRVRLSALRRGARQVVTGLAHSPFPLTAPVSRKQCVFYIEELSQRRISTGNPGAYNPTIAVGDNAHGAFFLRDGGSEAVVVPTFHSADINKEFDTASTEGGLDYVKTELRAEKCITEGETVSVLGTPRPLPELLRYLREGSCPGLPTSFIDELLRLEREGSTLPCFFADGVERVSDQEPEAYAARAGSKASMLTWIGAALLIASVLALLYLSGAFSGAAASPD